MSDGLTRAAKRQAMRQAGYRRSERHSGRRAGIRVPVQTEPPAIVPVATREPGLARTETGLLVVQTGITRLK